VQVADAEGLKVTGCLGEGGDRVGVGHAVGGAERRNPHADAAPAEHADHGCGHLAQQPGPVAGVSAVGVVALVGAVAQELVEQVAVAGVHLHPVEACRQRPVGGGAELAGDAGQLVGSQRPGLGEWVLGSYRRL